MHRPGGDSLNRGSVYVEHFALILMYLSYFHAVNCLSLDSVGVVYAGFFIDKTSSQFIVGSSQLALFALACLEK